MGAGRKLIFFVVFALTGFSALTLQVVWQRVISLHAGVDLLSFTTVVSAFLAGIGGGSLLGGWLADRLGARRSVLAFACSNLMIGAFVWVSVWLFYDLYRGVAPSLTSVASKFAFNVVLLLVPTMLMGVSLPLVAKAVVSSIGDAGSLIGRLYGINTLGAAFGAAVAGWLLLGTYGFTNTVRIAGTLNVVASILVALVFRSLRNSAAVDGDGDGGFATDGVRSSDATPGALVGGQTDALPDPADPERLPVWVWYVVYALTGAVALGFETVFFRMIDTIMRSNSYSFAHVLSIYLLLFGLGSALAAPIVKRVRRPDQWFLWLQFSVGVTALAGVVILTKVMPHLPFADSMRAYFGSEGFTAGFDGHTDALRKILQVFVGGPILILGLPVLCMGASFPFVQAIVAQRLETLGRRTGLLLFSNVLGNVAGTMIVGFVIIDRLGAAGTYKLLALILLVPALAATFLAPGSARRRIGLAVAATLVMAVFVRYSPTTEFLYARLHGVEMANLRIAEDRSCATTLRTHPNGFEELTINGSPQNGYPFDDFHVLIGLTPALVHPDPRNTMALGLGIGATPYGMSVDPRVDHVDAVEICGGEVDLLRNLGERRSPELRHFFSDPKVDVHVGDGRDFLLRDKKELDIVVVDTLRPQSAFSGNLYSVEFYELINSKLSDDGFVAQWIPSPRVLNTVLEVFPHVVTFTTPAYYNSMFFIASQKPVPYDQATLLQRLDAIDPATGLSAERKAAIREFYLNQPPDCVYDPSVTKPAAEEHLNRDLRPRDEYFLNQPIIVPPRASCVPTTG